MTQSNNKDWNPANGNFVASVNLRIPSGEHAKEHAGPPDGNLQPKVPPLLGHPVDCSELDPSQESVVDPSRQSTHEEIDAAH
eukprot:CAMPEP_0184318780 /NCGR_PEP_ID=MMETSP1049-20130417/104782_1 /TAXON_ID=77928 /ORGANISM="Proteomonas sulcata, Strain CCMP704" /LENGTH=81 /DNA_ID=CAMNT_0026638669 /DNA_START=225 /DNA_END=470 /DNA_ORIENTATION=-